MKWLLLCLSRMFCRTCLLKDSYNIPYELWKPFLGLNGSIYCSKLLREGLMVTPMYFYYYYLKMG